MWKRIVFISLALSLIFFGLYISKNRESKKIDSGFDAPAPWPVDTFTSLKHMLPGDGRFGLVLTALPKGSPYVVQADILMDKEGNVTNVYAMYQQGLKAVNIKIAGKHRYQVQQGHYSLNQWLEITDEREIAQIDRFLAPVDFIRQNFENVRIKNLPALEKPKEMPVRTAFIQMFGGGRHTYNGWNPEWVIPKDFLPLENTKSGQV